jgi:hypothetical protein
MISKFLNQFELKLLNNNPSEFYNLKISYEGN